MADPILSSSVRKILDTLTSLADEEISLAWGLENDLRRLKTTLSSIKAVLMDAEEQQTANHQITNWLRQLRNALYDAEDVLDAFEYQLLRNEVIKKYGGLNRKVRRFFSSSNPISHRSRIGHQIKDLRLRLDQIAADKAQFNLVDRPDICPVHLRVREMTHSFLNSSNIVGREEDREAIVEFLLDSHANVEVMPIVGMGGLGKTALTKMVFNDTRVVRRFGEKLWVCLGDMKEFHVNRVMEKIGQEMNVDHSNPQQLQKAIRDNLQDKRFLLVLDDVWDVNRDKWLEFISLLLNGCQGSKILVTSRIDLVARCVATVKNPYILQGLPHEECVSLFRKLAFASEDEVDVNLMKIGEDIVKKCKGVPLAIRCLGSLLFKESDEKEWLAVRDNSIWQIEECQKSILPILKFSYDHLPCHLKQCFVYCSIFPEDHEFEAQSVINFWMAHGLLQSPNETRKPEDVGKQYIKELLSRGFFQDSQYSTFLIEWTFKMHDLVRDLACSLGQEEFLIVNDNDKDKEIAETVRHVSFEYDSDSDNDKETVRNVSFKRQDCLRKSSNVIRTVFANSSKMLTKACIHQFKCLRFLRLESSDVEELPHSIGTLKHLRSLDLSMCISLERLPDSICKLHNLQTLNLRECTSLEELPEKIGELIGLRYLWISTQQKHLSRNSGIDCLHSLQFLGLNGCDELETLFEKIENLTLSLGTLVVEHCKSLVSSPVNYNLAALEVLYIFNCENLNLDASEFLHLPRLRSLTLRQVDLTRGLPEWIHGCSPTLQFLEIYSCRNLKELPEWLPNLSSLHTLIIVFTQSLKSLPQGMERLTALKTLTIAGSRMLQRRCEEERGEDWPMIAHVPNIDIQPV